jgi:hypothetical protein
VANALACFGGVAEFGGVSAGKEEGGVFFDTVGSNADFTKADGPIWFDMSAHSHFFEVRELFAF